MFYKLHSQLLSGKDPFFKRGEYSLVSLSMLSKMQSVSYIRINNGPSTTEQSYWPFNMQELVEILICVHSVLI